MLAHCHVLTCRSHPSSQIRAALSSAPLRESRLLTRVESTIFHPPGMTDPFRGTTFKRRQIAGTFLLPSPEHPHHPLPPPPRTPPRRRRAAPTPASPRRANARGIARLGGGSGPRSLCSDPGATVRPVVAMFTLVIGPGWRTSSSTGGESYSEVALLLQRTTRHNPPRCNFF